MLKPLFRRILLKRAPAEKKGNVWVPKHLQLRHASLRCVVVDVGADVNDKDITSTVITVGDTVIIGKHAGAWLDSNGSPVDDPETAEFYIIQDEDILAKVVDNE